MLYDIDVGKSLREMGDSRLFVAIARVSAGWSTSAYRQVTQELACATQHPHAVSKVPFGMTTKGCTGLGETSAQLSKLCCAGCAFLP